MPPEPVPSASIASPVAPPPAPMPDGADPEKFAIVTSICRAAYNVREKAEYGFDKISLGCRTNPPFVKPGQLPDGTLPRLDDASKDAEAAEDARYFCPIDGIYHGSFTRPGAKQTLVSFTACPEKGQVWDMGFPGSGVVVEEAGGGRYRIVDTVKDVNIGSRTGCKQTHLPAPADRDVLLCGGGFGAGAIDGRIGFYFTVDMARKDDKARTWILWGADELRCDLRDQLSYESTGITSFESESSKLLDVNGDGILDLVIEGERTHERFTRASLDARCNGKGRGPRPRSQKYRLELVSHGEEFGPSAATKKTLAAWEAETPARNRLTGSLRRLAAVARGALRPRRCA